MPSCGSLLIPRQGEACRSPGRVAVERALQQGFGPGVVVGVGVGGDQGAEGLEHAEVLAVLVGVVGRRHVAAAAPVLVADADVGHGMGPFTAIARALGTGA